MALPKTIFGYKTVWICEFRGKPRLRFVQHALFQLGLNSCINILGSTYWQTELFLQEAKLSSTMNGWLSIHFETTNMLIPTTLFRWNFSWPTWIKMVVSNSCTSSLQLQTQKTCFLQKHKQLACWYLFTHKSQWSCTLTLHHHHWHIKHEDILIMLLACTFPN